MLREEKITPFSKSYRKAKKLLRDDFQEHDRFPMLLLVLLSLNKDIEFKAYYDSDCFVGFYYGVICDNCFFVLYLAIDPSVQSKGYGSSIISLIKNKHKGNQIILNAEAPEEEAEDYEQRKRRISFYERNGISETKYYFYDAGEKYIILSSSESFSKEDFFKCLDKLSKGKYKIDIFV